MINIQEIENAINNESKQHNVIYKFPEFLKNQLSLINDITYHEYYYVGLKIFFVYIVNDNFKYSVILCNNVYKLRSVDDIISKYIFGL